jgi:hypothetical protein
LAPAPIRTEDGDDFSAQPGAHDRSDFLAGSRVTTTPKKYSVTDVACHPSMDAHARRGPVAGRPLTLRGRGR